MISDLAYIEIMKNCSKWNSKIQESRKKFIYDHQTQIVHRPTDHLFRSSSERIKPENSMQEYTYPSKRWVKSKEKSSDAIEMGYFMRTNPAIQEAANSMTNTSAPQTISENPGDHQGTPLRGNGPKLYENELDLTEFDIDEGIENDPSDEEDWGSSKKKSKKPGARGSGGRSAKKSVNIGVNANANISSGSATPGTFSGGTPSSTAPASESRPFICLVCGAKYKSRPGLTYHRIHVHQQESSSISNSNNSNVESQHQSPILSPKLTISNYCDFCLQGRDKNQEGRPEELVSCHDCGRSGHPTCLKFTPNMLISTKRHGWQCIECKSCAICGTSENDDQLLFCDDCDRGFHLYCLTPPLKSPPDSDWSCHLCVLAFGTEASINVSSINKASTSSK